nr:hypothetical protein HK105_004852 [Polyrhizophydium stewartii]
MTPRLPPGPGTPAAAAAVAAATAAAASAGVGAMGAHLAAPDDPNGSRIAPGPRRKVPLVLGGAALAAAPSGAGMQSTDSVATAHTRRYAGGGSGVAGSASILGSVRSIAQQDDRDGRVPPSVVAIAQARRELAKILDSITALNAAAAAATAAAAAARAGADPKSVPSQTPPVLPPRNQSMAESPDVLAHVQKRAQAYAMSQQKAQQQQQVQQTHMQQQQQQQHDQQIQQPAHPPVPPAVQHQAQQIQPPAAAADSDPAAAVAARKLPVVPCPPATLPPEKSFDRRTAHMERLRHDSSARAVASPDASASRAPSHPSSAPQPSSADASVSGHVTAADEHHERAHRHQRSNSEPGTSFKQGRHVPRRRSLHPEIPEEALEEAPNAAAQMAAAAAAVAALAASTKLAQSTQEMVPEPSVPGSADDSEDLPSPESASVEFEEEGIDLDAVKSVVVDNKAHSVVGSMASLNNLAAARPEGAGDAAGQRQDSEQPATQGSEASGAAQGASQTHAVAEQSHGVKSSPELPLDTARHQDTDAGSLFAKKSLSLPRDGSPMKRRSVFGQLKALDGPDDHSRNAVAAEHKPVSALSAMMDKKSSKTNPFALAYAAFSGKADPKPMRLQIFLPFSHEPSNPLPIAVKPEACVEEVIGYTLFEYVEQGRTPAIPESAWPVTNWNLRMVEDDGTVEEDFPALDRARKIAKFAFDKFALCETVPLEGHAAAIAQHRDASSSQHEMTATTSVTGEPAGSPSGAPAASVFLKVHLYSTLEVKQTTTMQMPLNIPMSEVFDRICRKRKYDPKDYVLKMADTKTDVPLDKTLEQLQATEFCVLKRSSGGAGDIFLRPPDEKDDDDGDSKPYLTTDDFRSAYKQYAVIYKHLMGRHERNLTIDGEYIHLVASEGKALFDMGKTTVRHAMVAEGTGITSCKQTKKKSANFKLAVRRDRDNKVYDLEASTDAEARDICNRITMMLELTQMSAGVEAR